jgi:hypothetical protein
MAEGIAFEMKAQDFPTIPARALMPEALKIAFTYDRSVYECLYLAGFARQVAGRVIARDFLRSFSDRYNDCMTDGKPFRLTESVRAAG